ncbi:hypothetical protein BLNAU_16278 [Blattamonas nauphoetae]|uniref:Uncharacterized protein n=1 Tax=Blattamonas nauphoetae TaxID=2049346 RepID=A0ABQ9XC34_9EUKA|nr:hypothetical protein BLNAU_16278 [Blattamonas nauphoetae]
MQNDLQSGIDHAIQDLVACDGISLSTASGDRMRNVVVEAIKLGQKRSLARPESLYVHHSRKTITKAITERSNTLFSTQFSSPLYRLTSLAIDSGTTAHKSYNVFVVLNSQEDSPPLLYNLDQNRHTNEILAASIGSTIDTLSQLKTLVLSIVTDGYRGFSSGLCGLSRIRHLQNGAAQSMHLWRIFFRDALTTMLDHIGPAQYEETMQIDLDDTTIADDGITPAENGSPMGMNSVLLSIQNRQWCYDFQAGEHLCGMAGRTPTNETLLNAKLIAQFSLFACALQVTPASEASCEREIARMRRTIGTTRYHTKPELLLAIHRIGLHKRLEKAQDKNDRRKEPDDSQVN